MSKVCHCGKDGHALNSINCPVHGWGEKTAADAPCHYGAEAADAWANGCNDILSKLGDAGSLITRKEAAAEIERLRSALKEIANPIAAIQERAKRDGHRIDGRAAITIADDPYYLKGLAKKALEHDHNV